MKRISISIAVALFMLGCGVLAFGDPTIAYTDPCVKGTTTSTKNSCVGDQYGTYNVALVFTVTRPQGVTLLDMGVFDATGTGKITGSTPIQVEIFNTATGAAVSGTYVVFQNGEIYSVGGQGYDVFQGLSSPVLLTPGTYEIDAVGFNPSYQNGNEIDGSSGPTPSGDGGALTFDEAAWGFNNPANTNPLAFQSTTNANYNTNGSCEYCNLVSSPDTVFDAGTFEYQLAAAPEPGTLFLMGSGALGLAALVRRKFRKAVS